MWSAPINIKVNNFNLFSSTACIVPYSSIYYISYSNASPGDFGKLKLLASLLSAIVLLLASCLIATRGGTRRPIGILSLLITFASFVPLLCPIISHYRVSFLNDNVINLDEEDTNFKNAEQLNTTSSNSTTNFSYQEPNDWSILIFCCLTIGLIGNSMSISLNELNELKYEPQLEHYTSRFWSALGAAFSSILLIITNKWLVESSIPWLLPPLTLYTINATLNIICVSFLSHELEDSDSKPSQQSKISGPRFEFGGKFWFHGKTLVNCAADVQMSTTGDDNFYGRKVVSKQQGILITKLNLTNQFDSRDEDLYRNIRRCSLAPLGDSFVIKQFELDNQQHLTETIKSTKQHFKHVTKIEPKGTRSNSDVIPTIELFNATHQMPGFCLQCSSNKPAISFNLCLQLGRILSRNKMIIKYLTLTTINGLIAGPSLDYLLPYLSSWDRQKFESLAMSFVAASSLSDITFCCSFNYLKRYISNHSSSFTSVLVIQGLRYSMYPVVLHYDLSMEWLLVVELLLSFTFGWSSCINHELTICLAEEASKFVEELDDFSRSGSFQSKLNDNLDASSLNEGMTILFGALLSSCSSCFGLALGSWTGGWLVDHYGYPIMWICAASVAFICGLVNFLIDLISDNKENANHSDENLYNKGIQTIY